MAIFTNMCFYIHKSLYDEMATYYTKTQERRPPDKLLWRMFQCKVIHKVKDTFFITAELDEELGKKYGKTFAISTIKGGTDIDYEIKKQKLKIGHEEATLKCASIATTGDKVYLVTSNKHINRLRKIVEKEGYKFKVIDIETALILVEQMKEIANKYFQHKEDENGFIEYSED